MNERIKELAEQASKHVTATVPFNDPSYAELGKLLASQDNTVLNAFKEKFAELIVRECMLIANTYQNRGGNCYVDDMIAKHFGVEE